MTTAIQTRNQRIPSGTYRIDPVHSSARFEVEHGALSRFRGGFDEVSAELEAGPDGVRLSGAVAVASVDIDQPDLRGHLLSPEFFDAERHPEIRFGSRELRIDGDGASSPARSRSAARAGRSRREAAFAGPASASTARGGSRSSSRRPSTAATTGSTGSSSFRAESRCSAGTSP